MRSNMLPLAAATLAALVAAHSQAQPTFILTDLTTIVQADDNFQDGTFDEGAAFGVTETGIVVGRAEDNNANPSVQRAFVWNPDPLASDPVIRYDPGLKAAGGTYAHIQAAAATIRASDGALIIVGASFDNLNVRRAFRVVDSNASDSNPGLRIDLSPSSDLVQSSARNVNSANTAVGWVTGQGATRWLDGDANGAEMGALTEPSAANDINEASLIVGSENDSRNAFFWRNGTDNGALPQTGGVNTAVARGVNSNGLVVGRAPIGGDIAPALWTPDGAGAYPNPPLALPLLSGDASGEALSVNDDGWAVGFSASGAGLSGTRRAVLWKPNVSLPGYHAIDITSAIDPAEGFTRINLAQRINNRAEIAGSGVTSAGKTHAVLLQSDQDSDLVPDFADNCPTASNSNQQDADGDGVGDVCDNCPLTFNPSQDPSACNSGGGGDCTGIPCMLCLGANCEEGGGIELHAATGSDLDGDGAVGETDMRILLKLMGSPGGIGDLNKDGVVDGADLAIMSAEIEKAP